MYSKLYNYQDTSLAILDNKRYIIEPFIPQRSLEERLSSRKTPTIIPPFLEKTVIPPVLEKTVIPPFLENNTTGGGFCDLGGDDGVQNICGSGKKLFPIMDPRFNLRETAKNMVLLEDHLFHSGKGCNDCIKKHAIICEALLEEATTLDKNGEYKEIITSSTDGFRKIFIDLSEKINSETLGEDECRQIAQEIRKVRKPLCQKYATFLK